MRTPGALNQINFVAMDVAKQALAGMDQVHLWQKLMRSKQPHIVLETLKYFTDRVAGKPAQMVIGDPTRPVSVELRWSAHMPDWMTEPVNVTPSTVTIAPARETLSSDGEHDAHGPLDASPSPKPVIPKPSLFDVE